MRRKRHKQTRRGMRFYRINFGFREPYKVCVWSGVEAKETTEATAIRGGPPPPPPEHRVLAPRALTPASPFPASLPPPQVLLDGNFVHALRETK